MSLLEQLLGANNGVAVDQISRQFGLSPSQSRTAIDALLPTVAAGFQRNASAGAGLEGLLGSLAGGASTKYADDPTQLSQPAAIDAGNGILGQIFGSKDVSRDVATRASAQSGIGPEILKAMLPMVATMVMSAIAKGTFAGGASQVGQPHGAAAAPGGGLFGMLTPMLDADKDGSAMDDLMGMMGKHLK